MRIQTDPSRLSWRRMAHLALSLVLLLAAAAVHAPHVRAVTGPTIARAPIAGGGSHTLAIGADSSAWAWGFNGNGQAGDGTTEKRLNGVQVSGLSGVRSVSGGWASSAAVKADGTVWTWGHNAGRLGDGTYEDRTVPVQVAGLTDVVAVSMGYDHTLALRADGTVWAWGEGSYGQRGDGTTTYLSAVPVQVLGLTDVVDVAAGAGHSLAVKSDGTLWAWGSDEYGQLGNGTQTNSSVPVQVASLSDIVAVAADFTHSLALRSDGTVWAWGWNYHGHLGDGTKVDRLTPVQVIGLNDVVDVAAGSGHSLALRSDGTVWAWGINWSGQLGIGAVSTGETAPIKVNDLTDVVAIAAGYGHSLALRSDGTVWAWGSNSNGALGDGTETDRHSPVQIFAGAPQAVSEPPVALTPAGNGWVTSTTPTLTWTFQGGDTQTAFQVQVLNADGSVAHDSGQVSSGDGSYLMPAGALTEGSYSWQVRTWNSGGAPSPFTTADFRVDATPPAAALEGPSEVDEGEAAAWTVAVSDSLSGVLQVSWDQGDGSFADITGQMTVSATFPDDGVPVLRLRAADQAGNETITSLSLTVRNVSPEVTSLTVPDAPVTVGAEVSISATFSDPGLLDTHTAAIDWGDGTASAGAVTETDGSGAVAGTHHYAAPGVYPIRTTVTDKDGGTGTAMAAGYVVVYDPTGGFVTGGGWIASPAGAYREDPSLAGKATFGFVSRYRLGASTPSGQTQFQFKAANLTFQSTAYDWLVVAGARAQYKGRGTIGGVGDYSFMLTVIDGAAPGGGGTDKFRLKIWDDAGIVYDNQLDAEDTADPTTVLGGGSIVIHK